MATNTKGCAPVCTSFTLANGSSMQSIAWDLGDGSANGVTVSHCYTTARDYSVVANVVDLNGCTNSTAIMVNVYPIPVADFNYAPIKPVVNEDQVTFTDASYSANAASWNWYFNSTALNTSNLQNPTFVYTEAGANAVTLVVKSDKGCSDTITKSLFVNEDFGVFVPNTFTPNGDGLNDLFFAKGYGITKFEFEVYDRWGEKLFSSTDINEAWDGSMTARGNKQIKEGIYTWRMKLVNVYGKTKELTGHVTLIK